MSAKLNLFSSILLFAIFSCSLSKPKKFFHTEISCPGKPVIVVRYTTLAEVKSSIAKDNEDKKNLGTKEDYTVIYASGGRSVMIQKISPEDILKCSLREIPVINPDRNITRDY